MRLLALITTALIAPLAIVVAAPAHAEAVRPVSADAVQAASAAATLKLRTAMDGSTVCLRAASSTSCASYQAQLLRTVGQKAAGQPRAITVNDLSRRQLDALIASVN